MMPHFVIIILGEYPALAGLFLAALFSGSLSSLSSGINALAANTVQDLLVNYLANVTQARKTLLAKLLVFGYGIIAVGIAYAMKSLSGPVTQISSSAFGACGGPYVGMFFLGAIFPQANWIGALTGGVIGILFNVWLALSAMFRGNSYPISPPISTSGCLELENTMYGLNSTTPQNMTLYGEYAKQELTTDGLITSDLQNRTENGHIPLYDISYLYFGLTGFFVSLLTGLLVSLIVHRRTENKYTTTTSPKYIFPFLRNVWSFEKRSSKNADIVLDHLKAET